MKCMYFAATSHENGKNHAHVIKVPEANNLLAVLRRFKNLKVCQSCPTKWKAEDTVSFWNESYKENGTFGFITL